MDIIALFKIITVCLKWIQMSTRKTDLISNFTQINSKGNWVPPYLQIKDNQSRYHGTVCMSTMVALRMHLHCSKCHNFLPFYSWIIFYYMYTPHFVYPFNHGWPFRLLLAIVNYVAMNAGVQIPLWDPAFNSSGYIFRSTIAGWYGNSIFNVFEKPPYC